VNWSIIKHTNLEGLSKRPSTNIHWALKLIFSGLVVAVILHSVYSFFGAGYPWNTFLFDPNDRFNDWFNSVDQATSNNPYHATGPALATYFPASYVLFKIGFGLHGVFGKLIYLCVTAILFAGAFATINQSLFKNCSLPLYDKFALLILSIFSYPVLFSIDRGNIDLWISLLCAIFIFSNALKFEIVGVIALSLAISFKGYPAAFLLLLLSERKYLAFLTSVILAILLTLIPMVFMWDGFDSNLDGFIKNLHMYKEIYVIGHGSLFASSDPYNALRLLFFSLFGIEKEVSESVYHFYKYFSAIFAIVISVYVLFVQKTKWKKIIAVSILAILFPYVANDYKLCMLLPGFYMLIFENLEIKKNKYIFLSICLLLIPKSFFFIHGKSVSMVINPIILSWLVFLVVHDSESWRYFFKNVLNTKRNLLGRK